MKLTSIFSISLPHECHSLFPQSSRIPWRTHTLTAHSARIIYHELLPAVCVYIRSDIGLTRADQRLSGAAHAAVPSRLLCIYSNYVTSRIHCSPHQGATEAAERGRARPSPAREVESTARMARRPVRQPVRLSFRRHGREWRFLAVVRNLSQSLREHATRGASLLRFSRVSCVYVSLVTANCKFRENIVSDDGQYSVLVRIYPCVENRVTFCDLRRSEWRNIFREHGGDEDPRRPSATTQVSAIYLVSFLAKCTPRTFFTIWYLNSLYALFRVCVYVFRRSLIVVRATNRQCGDKQTWNRGWRSDDYACVYL